jgi:energy-coupling factor transporter ATP-binding protein EcfA2
LLASELYLQKLDEACTSRAWYNSDRVCLPGTRKEHLQVIHSWINGNSSKHILLLTGEAGTGKSTIARTIAHIYYEMDRLGSAYCFSRNESELARMEAVIPTIARDLAGCEPQMKVALCNAIKNRPAIVQTRGMKQQFKELFLEPLGCLNTLGPIILVIDALDESNQRDRHFLLDLLREHIAELPSNFRIIITARPDADICEALVLHSSVEWKKIADISPESTSCDIGHFIHHELGHLQKEFDNFNKTCDELTQAAGALFEWAAIACRAIIGSKHTMTSVKDQVSIILSPGPQSSGVGILDKLYTRILKQVIQNQKPSPRYRTVISHILATAEPLSIQSLDDILTSAGAVETGDVKLVVEPLGALFSGTNELDRVVQPLHASFRDYLLDEKRSKNFTVNVGSQQHTSFTKGSLAILNKQLHFNMCRLETSYKLNIEYNNLSGYLVEKTSACLVYAAVYWGKHLEQVQGVEEELMATIIQLFEKKGLFWIEALSLLGALNTGPPTLTAVKNHIKLIKVGFTYRFYSVAN